jgi:hypothetical protein
MNNFIVFLFTKYLKEGVILYLYADKQMAGPMAVTTRMNIRLNEEAYGSA